MAKVFRRTWLARLAGLAALGATGRSALARPQQAQARPQAPAQDGPTKGDPDPQPSPLWIALLRALPEEFRTIDVYAENPSRTLVCFRSNNQTLIFESATSKVRVIAHQRAIGRINRIAFEARSADLMGFVLYLDGSPQLTILAKR